MSFSNGVTDHLDLTHYKMFEKSEGGCNYLGRLKNDSYSSVGVTGCLNEPGDTMEIVLMTNHNDDIFYLVDFYGNVKVLPTPDVQKSKNKL